MKSENDTMQFSPYPLAPSQWTGKLFPTREQEGWGADQVGKGLRIGAEDDIRYSICEV